MADNPNPTPTPTPEPTPSPEPTPAPAPTPEAKPAPEKTYTKAEYDAAMAKAQKDWEKKTKDAEAKSKLSEDEKLKSERDDAVKTLRERDQRDNVQDKAKTAGVNNPKTFFNAYKSDFEYDEKGNVTNFDDVLAIAKVDSPELFTKASLGSIDAGDGTKPGKALTKEMVSKMTPAEINKNWEAVSQFLASQK